MMPCAVLEAADLPPILAAAKAAARQAAELIRQVRREGFRVEKKGLVDLVTDCDRRSEALLVGALREAYPEHGIVGEEGGVQANAGDERAPTWYIDPLDGTTNFAHGLPWYSVSLGLEQGGRRLVGVVVAPEIGWEFSAHRGGGATLNDQPLSVSETADLDGALVATGFAYDRRESPRNNLDEFRALLLRCQGLRRFGAASIDCAMVACGWLDAYWELKLQPWDISAGALLVEEAGGLVTDTSGRPFLSTAPPIVASNGRFHRELLDALRVTARHC